MFGHAQPPLGSRSATSSESSEESEGPGLIRRISSNLQRQTHGDLVRTTSQVLSGGVPGGPALLRSSTRQAQERQEQRQQRINEEMQNVYARYCKLFCFLILAFFVLLLTYFGVTVWAVLSALMYQDKPCDQPLLKSYILVVLAWVFLVGPQISARVVLPIAQRFECSQLALVLISQWTLIPTFSILAWGIYMILNSKTCHETNPEIFYSTEAYMIVQCLFIVFYTTTAIVAALFSRYALQILSRLSEGPGCQEAVAKLPEVPADSKDLIDPEDGTVMNCVVCLDALNTGKAAVRCPCNHIFHVDCLAAWAKSHTTCPTCREEIGQPDEECGSSSEGS